MVALPIGNKYTPRSTPLHVSQLIRLYLEETCKSFADDHPFRYRSTWEDSAVLFDTVYNKESDTYGGKPLILVSSEGYSYSNVAQGDLAHVHINSMNSRKTAMVNSATIIKVIGDTYGSVDILANEVFNMLITARTLLPNVTTIHQITGISATPVATFDEGDHMYYSQITLSYIMQYLWIHVVPENILRSIDLTLNNNSTIGDIRNTIIE